MTLNYFIFNFWIFFKNKKMLFAFHCSTRVMFIILVVACQIIIIYFPCYSYCIDFITVNTSIEFSVYLTGRVHSTRHTRKSTLPDPSCNKSNATCHCSTSFKKMSTQNQVNFSSNVCWQNMRLGVLDDIRVICSHGLRSYNAHGFV